MTLSHRRSPGVAGLGALMLGLLSTPWAYEVFFGALRAFPSPYAAVVLPALTVATLYLLVESFAPLRGFEWARWAGSVTSAAIVLTTLWYLSRFTLLNQAARLGLFATVWLGASLFWLLVSLPFRAFGPEARLNPYLTSPMRKRVALVTALLLLGALSMLAWHYVTKPAQFIGGPTSTEIG